MVGKIRLTCHPKLNHRWPSSLTYPSGACTGRIPYSEGGRFEIAFNFIRHTLEVRTCTGELENFSMAGLSVAAFCEKLFALLEQMGLLVAIHPYPYQLTAPLCFLKDDRPRSYDASAIHNYFSEITNIFEVFRGCFRGKASPVRMFLAQL